jgi:hypothetical protein
MRGQAFPTNLMVAPGINGYMKDLDKRPALLKPEEAKKLLADAGYPNGFEVGMDCPNDRYVNDEKICQAVVAMLAKIGVKVNLRAQTRNLYFAKILRKGDLSAGDTSFYMLGWSPAQTYDVHNVFEALIQTTEQGHQEGPVQRRRLFEPRARQRWPKRWSRRPTRPSATPRRRGHQALCRRLRLHPAAPAGAGVGDAQEHRSCPAGRQQLPAALRDGEIAAPEHRKSAPAAHIMQSGPVPFWRNPARPAPGPTIIRCSHLSCDVSCNPSPCCWRWAGRLFLFRYVGDPINAMVGQDTSHGGARGAAQKLGLNDRRRSSSSLHRQCSARQFRPVLPHLRAGRPLILERVPATLELSFCAAVFALFSAFRWASIPASIPALVERLLQAVSLIGISLPTFLIGILLILVFASACTGCPRSDAARRCSLAGGPPTS